MKILLYVRTLINLKFSQIYYYIARRYLSYNRPFQIDKIQRNLAFTLVEAINCNGIYKGDFSFNFLNNSIDFESKMIRWQDDNATRLWLYNLHYFDYLREKCRSDSNKSFLIDSWILDNPQGASPGWEPYTASLRIVNWIFYFVSVTNSAVDNRNISLYKQTLWLERNIELHILANHFFENLKALAFSGMYFSGDDAERWLGYSVRNIKHQLSEQFLSDGGHYERSPMYHAIMLENLLDLYNLFHSNDYDDEIVELLCNTIKKSLDYLVSIKMPDGKVPMFNDSVNGIAPEISDLISYAKHLSVYSTSGDIDNNGVINMKETGLFGHKSNDNMLLVKCSPVEPVYQPGHTHCDLLSYELCINGRRVIVDTGVYDYANSEERLYCRSTRAHNTVEIDHMEQSEIWSQFRIARRAKVHNASIFSNDNGQTEFTGCYSPYWSSKYKLTHCRNIKFINKSFVINDSITGSGVHTINNYIHLHPDIKCISCDEGFLLTIESSAIAKLLIEDSIEVNIEDGWYYPEFGIKIKNTVIRLFSKSELPVSHSYEIHTLV